MAEYIREMTGAELASMLKSSINLKSGDGLRDPELKLSDEEMKWWQDAKIGFMFHWGLYSILGTGEWTRHNEKISNEDYAKLADEFNPKNFDANGLADIAKMSGAKYAVMVTRHHDGFAMWDSPGSYDDFTSYKTAAKRDFVKEYMEAFRAKGLNPGLYYSPMDWRFNGYWHPKEDIENAALLKKQCYDQIEELMSKYGDVSILWYDGGWLSHKGSDADAAWFWEPLKLNRIAKKYQPHIVINPRSGYDGDFKCDEGGHDIKGSVLPIAWEKGFTLQKCWSYANNEASMPFERVLNLIVNAAIRNGNTMFNVGPDRNGKIPETVLAELKKLGAWLEKYGDSIYGTRGGPIDPVDYVYGCTQKEGKIFIHILDFEKFKEETIAGIPKVKSVETIDGRKVNFVQNENGLKISLADDMKMDVDTVLVLILI